MRDDEIDTDAPAGPEPRSRGRPGQGHGHGQGRGELDATTRGRLGRALRAHYADLLSAPVPERFAALIAGLDGGIPLAAGPPAEASVEETGQEDAR
ncbi:NepR family anti-sigma factor [Methylobacterium sp. EM32]|uniref:NepR family anti-sigma factor n=1 Tax=Methylobacterium sp. EM32 TaxID=3163481 RepID=UPI0033BAE1AB